MYVLVPKIVIFMLMIPTLPEICNEKRKEITNLERCYNVWNCEKFSSGISKKNSVPLNFVDFCRIMGTIDFII